MSLMKVLFFAVSAKGAGKRLRDVIESIVPAENIESYFSLTDLSHRLNQPKENVAVAILLTSKKKTLFEMHSINRQLQDIRIILVAPDHGKQTIVSAHKLFPKYLTYADSDFKDVGAVLKKILKNADSTKNFKGSTGFSA